METILKWLNKPKADDKSLLARFFHADRALAQVANELDSFDGRTEPERCSRLVTRLRQGQDKVLAITDLIIDELLGDEREPRTFRAKFPEEVLQENLAGQLWFGAECLAAGSSIMNREQESKEMRPLAEAVTRSLNNVRHLLRDQCLRNNVPNSERLQLDKNDAATEQLCESLKIFDRLFAEFEWRYVSAMVQVKSKDEYETQELICVLCSETLQRALKLGLLEQEQVDTFDPALMFSIPRLAIVAGLIIYPDGPLNMNQPAEQLSEMFRPFRSILIKVRDFLSDLNEKELYQLEHLLCTNENTGLNENFKCTDQQSSNTSNNDNNNNYKKKNVHNNTNIENENTLSDASSSSLASASASVSVINNESNINKISMSGFVQKRSSNRKVYKRSDNSSPILSTTNSSAHTCIISPIDDDIGGSNDGNNDDTHSRCITPIATSISEATKTILTPKKTEFLTSSSSSSSPSGSMSMPKKTGFLTTSSSSSSASMSISLSTPSGSVGSLSEGLTQASALLIPFTQVNQIDDQPTNCDKWLIDEGRKRKRRKKHKLLMENDDNDVDDDNHSDNDDDNEDNNIDNDSDNDDNENGEVIEGEHVDDADSNLHELDCIVEQIKNLEISVPTTTAITTVSNITVGSDTSSNNSNHSNHNLLQSNNMHHIFLDVDAVFLIDNLHGIPTATTTMQNNNDEIDELPTTSAMALQNNDGHNCLQATSLSSPSNICTSSQAKTWRNTDPTQIDRISDTTSQDSCDLKKISFEHHRQCDYGSNDNNISMQFKCRKIRHREHCQCHDQCGTNMLAYGKEYARISHKSQCYYRHHHYYHCSHSNSHHHYCNREQKLLGQHYCKNAKHIQRNNSDGNSQVYDNNRRHHHHFHHRYKPEKLQQQESESKKQYYQRRYRLHHHSQHQHYHHNKCNDKIIKEYQRCTSHHKKGSSDTSTTVSSSGSANVSSNTNLSDYSIRSNKGSSSNSSSTTSITNISKRDSIIIENEDVMTALNLNINCPTTATYPISENDKENMSDPNGLKLKRVRRLISKRSDILLHRLFVCIAGVADQLQTNFAFDLRQILRSVFLMNMTPARDDDDNDDDDNSDSANGNAANIMEKSKESDFFEFRVSENDVVQQESAGGSSQSLSSAEEVNIEMDSNTSTDSTNTSSHENNSNQYVTTFQENNATVPTTRLPNIAHSRNTEATIAMKTNVITTITTSTIDFTECNGSSINANANANLSMNTEKCGESSTMSECRHKSNNNNNNNSDSDNVNVNVNNHNHDMNCHHDLIVSCNRYRSRDSNKTSTASSCSPSSSDISSDNNSPLYDCAMQQSVHKSSTNIINSTTTMATTTTTTIHRIVTSTAAVGSDISSDTDTASGTVTVTQQQQQQQRLKPPAWIPDQKAPRCMSCNVLFTAFRRRHHCRNCGKVFCGMCSSNSAPLPKYGLTKAVRVCRSCFTYDLNRDRNLIRI